MTSFDELEGRLGAADDNDRDGYWDPKLPGHPKMLRGHVLKAVYAMAKHDEAVVLTVETKVGRLLSGCCRRRSPRRARRRDRRS